MPRFVVISLLAALAGVVRADPPAEAVALQKAVHQLIDAAEPSIACVLISRSEKYEQLGEGPTAIATGKLGEFTPGRHVKFGDGARRELVKRLDLERPDTVPEAFGSGVVIDDRGLILTNFHVIDRATKIFVRLPGAARGSYADILAADGRSDLAVLKMIRPPADLKAVPFGDGGKVRKGDWVIALANPFAAGFKDGSPSASWGIISNVRRRVAGPADEVKRAKPLAQYGTLLQTDARLNLGCSGGALLNLDGKLIGLTTSLAALAGGEAAGGYAIPLDTNVKKMIEILKRGEEIEYGFLGVTVNTGGTRGRPWVSRSATSRPVSRRPVPACSAATSLSRSTATRSASRTICSSTSPRRWPGRTPRSRSAAATGRGRSRPGWPSRATPSQSSRPTGRGPVFGLRVDYASTLSIDTNPPEGVLIREIEPGSQADKKKELKDWADRARLIVVAVNGKPVPTPSDFYREAAGKGSVTLDIVDAGRESTRRTVTLP